MKITNISNGPRGLNTTDGPVTLNPGEMRDDLKLEAAEEKIARNTNWFEFGAKAETIAQEPDLAKMSDDELRHLLKERGITADGRWGRDKLLAEAAKAKPKD